MRRGVVVLCVAVGAAACSKDEPPQPAPPATPEQCVVLYMPGRDLLRFFEQNISGVREAVAEGALGNGRFLVCYQPESAGSALLIELFRDAANGNCVTREVARYAPFDAGNADDVRQMLDEAARYAPAERYGLIIGCHGQAWIPKQSAGSSVAAPMQTGDGAGVSAADDLWGAAPGALPTRSFGDTGHQLDIAELAGILESLPLRYDYLLFDDCFMSNIETLYDLRHATDYIIASPCEIMAAGFPYARIVPHLFGAGSTRERLAEVCRTFWDFYANDWQSVPNNRPSGCIALTETAGLEALAESVRAINATGQESYDREALQTYEGLMQHLYYDLGDFVYAICSDAALRAEFDRCMEVAFPPECRLRTEQFYSRYNDRMNPITHYTGVSVSEPSSRYTSENHQTAWYRDTH